MGRGLDGLISRSLASCAVLRDRAQARAVGPAGVGLEQFPVAIAWGKHLFPFRTEQLSPTAPMVLGSQGPGRVGRRRFLDHEPPTGRLVCVSAAAPAAAARHERQRRRARGWWRSRSRSAALVGDASAGAPTRGLRRRSGAERRRDVVASLQPYGWQTRTAYAGPRTDTW